MATLLSTSVTGTVNSTGNMTAAGFTGNANVGGTGSATWHPSGIYVGSTQWLYGTMYKNGSAIYDAGEITTSSHGTSANWKSAYDWGNHASAGYITSSGSISGTAARATRANGNFYIDDNYGMDPFVRVAMKRVFPELNFVEIPFNHPIYNQKYRFESGLPKIHKHDEKPAQGFGLFWDGRLVCFYSYECDLGDGWEDQEVHNDSEEARLKALKMGANMVQYVFGN
jgi:hypothetical protein